MKKSIGICIVLMLACGSAQALDYSWLPDNTLVNFMYNNAANWDNGTGGSLTFPTLNTDNVLIATGGYCTMPTDYGTYTVGRFTVAGGSLIYGWYSHFTLVADSAGGLNGDVDIGGTGTYASSAVFDVDGNFRYRGTHGMITQSDLILRGTGKSIQIDDGGGNWFKTGTVYGSYTDTGSAYGQGGHFNVLTVKSTGELAGGNWLTHRLIVESGGLVNADIGYVAKSVDNTGYEGGKLLIAGGIVYNGNIRIGSQYNGGNVADARFVWKMDGGGDLNVNKDLYLGHNSTYLGGTYWAACHTVLDTSDNGTGTSRNVNIRGDLVVNPSKDQNGISYQWTGMLVANSSTIDVGGTVYIGSAGDTSRTWGVYPYGSVHLGSSTVNVGGDWRVSRSPSRLTTEFIYQNWDQGTSTVVFDGNGMDKTQTIYSDEMPLHNLHVNVLGTVQLNDVDRDNLILTGNLRIEAGTFDAKNRWITFNGGKGEDCGTGNVQSIYHYTTAQDIGKVLIAAGSSTFVELLSDVAMDNLDIDSGCALVLNDHTLYTDGLTITTQQTDWMGVSGAMIFQNWGEVPEPGTMLLIGTGVLGLLGYIRRRRMQ